MIKRASLLIPAERVGFEPTVPLLVHELSKLARSATLTPLHFVAFPFGRDAKVSKFCKHYRLL